MPIEERDLVYEVEDLDENNKVRVLYYKKSEIENQIANFEISHGLKFRRSQCNETREGLRDLLLRQHGLQILL